MIKRFLIALLTLLFLTTAVSAETTVTCSVPAGYTTIQAAIDDATCTDINIAAGYYTGPQLDLTVGRSLSIRGAGSTGSASVATYLNYRVLVTNNAVVTLEDLAIDAVGPSNGVELSSVSAGLIGNNITIYGSLGFGVYDTFGANTGSTFARLSNCNIRSNAGGVNVVALEMTNCNVYGNNIFGGVRINDDSTIRDSNIYNNQLDWNDQSGLPEPNDEDGAGILFAPSSASATLLIENSSIYDNTTTTHSPLTVVNSDGGGIMVRRGDVTIRNSEIYGNVAGRYGGGIHVHYTFDSSLTLESSTVRNNTAYDRGGGINIGNDTIIIRSEIHDNVARFDANFNGGGFASGAGVAVSDSAQVTIRETTIRENETDSVGSSAPVNSGGGIYVSPNFSGGSLTVEQSTINDNYAQADGGGVYARNGVVLRNVTIANNRADNDGGGLFAEGTASFLHNATVVGNSADFDQNGTGDGGGIAGIIRTNHALIALNEDPTDASRDCSGNNIISQGHSLLSISDGCPNFKSGTDLVGDASNPIDPQVFPIDDNGGWTQTISLDKRSPAVDTGSLACNGVTVDQRAADRVGQDGNANGSDGNHCDIGAFEISANVPIPTAVSLQSQQALAVTFTVMMSGFTLLLLVTTRLIGSCLSEGKIASVRFKTGA